MDHWHKSNLHQCRVTKQKNNKLVANVMSYSSSSTEISCGTAILFTCGHTGLWEQLPNSVVPCCYAYLTFGWGQKQNRTDGDALSYCASGACSAVIRPLPFTELTEHHIVGSMPVTLHHITPALCQKSAHVAFIVTGCCRKFVTFFFSSKLLKVLVDFVQH